MRSVKMREKLQRLSRRWISRLLILGLLVLSIPCFVLNSKAAPLAGPSVSVNPDRGLAGSKVTVSGSGFSGGYSAVIRWDGADKKTVTMTPNGTFSTSFTIPADASPGAHTISVCNNCGGKPEEIASVGFKVTTLPTSTFTPKPPTRTFTPVSPTMTRTRVPSTHTLTPPLVLITPIPASILPPPSRQRTILFDMGPDVGITLIEFLPYQEEETLYYEDMISEGFEDSMQVARPSVSPHSGEFAAKSIEGDFVSTPQPIRMMFTRSLRAVGMYVGIEEGPSMGKDVMAKLIVFGYQDGGLELIELGFDSIVFPSQPADIVYPLRFVADEGDVILQAILDYTDSEGISIPESRWMDDLTLAYAEEVELPEDLPPGVYFFPPEDPSMIIESTEDVTLDVAEQDLPGEVFVDQHTLSVPSCTPNSATFSTVISDPSLNPQFISLLILPPDDASLIGIEMERTESGVYEGTLKLNEDSPTGDWIYSVLVLDEAGVSYHSEAKTIAVNECVAEAPASRIGDQLIDLAPYLAIGAIVLSSLGLAGITYFRVKSARRRLDKVSKPEAAEGGAKQETTESARRDRPPGIER